MCTFQGFWYVCVLHLNVLYACRLDGVQVGEYNTMFNAHLRRCVTNRVLPVAADTLEFMLAQGIPLDTSELQHLIHKLGKQNSWSRARILFKRESHTLLWHVFFFLLILQQLGFLTLAKGRKLSLEVVSMDMTSCMNSVS